MVYTPSAMLKTTSFKVLKSELARSLAQRIQEAFGIEHEPAIQTPPRRDLGDIAFPGPLHLARVLKRKPRDIAQEILEGLELPAGVREVRIEGAGYLNAFLDRGALAASLVDGVAITDSTGEAPSTKIVVEHTNINPNKAAHIGHLRNAILGDILGRTLRSLGYEVEIQNYIDDTGVQVGDVVVGFMDLRNLSREEVRALPEPFDYYCWDLYSEVGTWYEADPERLALRRQTLHALENDEGPRAAMGRLVARRIVHRHLKTMGRLGISYDLLTRESDILQLDFFKVAFEKLKESGAIRLESEGKNQGCWVMPLAQSAEFAGLEDPDKVIVRSDGTVTYVGKDIAYQMWKFGVLGQDFLYRHWDDESIWQTISEDGGEAPQRFGHADKVINVIDARQSYLQKIVRVGLEVTGFAEQAERSVHFGYEMVSLSRGTARQLGFLDGDDDTGKSLEMSGRKGIGVKADDLLDQLSAKSRATVSERFPELDDQSLDDLANQIATAAIRFFMVKATTTRVIAFDLDEAMRAEGETGLYLLYSMVRERNIRRKLQEAGLATELTAEQVLELPSELWSDDLWDLVWTTAQIPEIVEKAGESLELSLIARHALDLTQKFHHVYHNHPILKEPDADLRQVRLAAVQIFARGLVQLMELMGLPIPEKM